jgi:hypothetical protein
MTIKDKPPAATGPALGTVVINGGLQVALFAGGQSQPVCRGNQGLLTACSSSLRYKTDVKPFSGGLQLIDRLQPVSFTWKENQQPDIGLIAEDVAIVEPRLTFNNQDGAVEGVNYLQLTATLINAVKEQQKEIEELRSALERLEKVNDVVSIQIAPSP